MGRSRIVLVALAVVASVVAAHAEPSGAATGAALSPQALSSSFAAVLQQQRVPAGKVGPALDKFSKLPASLQADIVSITDPQNAADEGLSDQLMPVGSVSQSPAANLAKLLPPKIKSMYHAEGSRGKWAYVLGSGFNENCQVKFGYQTMTSNYLSLEVGFLRNALAFVVPNSAQLGQHSVVQVLDKGTNKLSDAFQYTIVAPRGYRGLRGWQFANFGNPTIPWEMYRDYFGAAAVEYSNGTHRPSAQLWYDGKYKGVGTGGNCLGMSIAGLRVRDHKLTTYWHDWFTSHPEAYCWLYPFSTETKQAVQEDQGSQLSLELSALTSYYYNHQDHKAAWKRIHDLVLTAQNRPVIGFHCSLGGHAVVPYATEVSGSHHIIKLYDNNKPYKETETGGPDLSVGYVDWNDNTFHLPPYFDTKHMICLSYQECIFPPHLPEAVSGAYGTTCASVAGGSVQQIEDQAGHKFFNGDGSVNDNPNTRIPDAMEYVPFGGLAPSADGQRLFVFNQSTGKNLTFTIAGAGQKSLQLFQAGHVLTADFAGQGRIRLNGLLSPTRSLEVLSPDTTQLTGLRCIHALAQERVFELSNLTGLGTGSVLIRPDASGAGLHVESATGAKFDLRAETFAAGAVRQVRFANLQVDPGSRAILTPGDWSNLATTSLGLNLQRLNGQQIRNIKVPPVR